jgi:hypothetical protein
MDITAVENRIKVEPNEEVVNITFGDVVSLTTSEIKTITENYQCGEDIGSGKAVYLSNIGKIYMADNSNTDIINAIVGVTKQAGSSGDIVEVVIQGEVGYVFADRPGTYYVYQNGLMDNAPPATDVIISVGRYIRNGYLLVNIGNYIIRN